MTGLRRRTLLLALGGAGTWPAAFAAGPADPADAAEVPPAVMLHGLFQRYWEAQARRHPEEATLRGDLRYNDRWTDTSLAARAEEDAAVRGWLAEARAIPREALPPVDQVSLDLFVRRLQDAVEGQAFTGWRGMLIGSMGGPQVDLSGFLQRVPVDTLAQAEALLLRLARYPAVVEGQLAQLREGMALGWVSPREVLRRALAQLDEQLAQPVQTGPWFEPLRRLGAAIPAAEQQRLRTAAAGQIETRVVPALRALRAFMADTYLPRAPEQGALASYPGGENAYAFVARTSTTTSLAPREIHEIGLRELASLRAEMETVMRSTGFRGEFSAYVAQLLADPHQYHESPQALLAGYRDIAKRLDAQLPRLFAELPRIPYGVKAMPAHMGPDTAEYYESPALDGSRAGFFNANAVGFRSRPKWRMATLVAHEAVPGHHLQIARAMELRGLPEFRREAGYTAFVEGWAVYAETLAREVGMYEEPTSLFGHLQWRAFRAARLVVDTGLQTEGWSRQRAIDFMVERTGMDRSFVESEVDRYISDPGQALGYMVGALRFKALREQAHAALGERFDLRRFHNLVLDSGALPLDVLEHQVQAWIAAEKQHAA
ncbi:MULTISPECIES: DUF885 domain-containing protein [Ramlibacter]|nr:MULTISPECIES: DUF885 domain-containing protein [Ramlibacter]